MTAVGRDTSGRDTSSRDTSGGKSFLDLSGELRNAIYEHFIDLNPDISEAVKLLSVNQQIRSEFGSLYLSRGSATIDSDYVISFLHIFFLNPDNMVPKDVACKFCVDFDLSEPYLSLDLLEIVSVMRQNPLLNITWMLAASGCSESLKDSDLVSTVAVMRSMEAQQFKKLVRVNLYVLSRWSWTEESQELYIHAELCILLKGRGTEQDLHELGFDVKIGGIYVCIKWVGGSESNTDESDSSEDDSDSDS